MKTLNITIETLIKIVILSFIFFALGAVTIEIFSDLTLLNRAF